MKKKKANILVILYAVITIFVITAFCLIFFKIKPASEQEKSEIDSAIETTQSSETTSEITTETTATTTSTDVESTSSPVEETSVILTTAECTQEYITVTKPVSIESSSVYIGEDGQSETDPTTTVTKQVTVLAKTSSAPTPISIPVSSKIKTVDEIAMEVWQGKWSVGATRKRLLEAAGYNYSEVQKKVNELAGQKNTTVPNNSNTKTKTNFVKTFSRGTYYAYGGPRKGGSGRQLIDCSIGNGTVKGSIASSYLYKRYGYNYGGKRTKVYLEVKGYSQMNGYYYLDDSDAGNPNVIDFFFLRNGNCPFRKQGVVSVNCYIVK